LRIAAASILELAADDLAHPLGDEVRALFYRLEIVA
jgi:hypothetical protein